MRSYVFAGLEFGVNWSFGLMHVLYIVIYNVVKYYMIYSFHIRSNMFGVLGQTLIVIII